MQYGAESMSEGFLDGEDTMGGKRLSSQLLHRKRSPWQFFTCLWCIVMADGDAG